jgi:hypothetical protein
MHLLQVFLLGWFSVGLATVVFMFWLCKRTAASIKDPATASSLAPPRAEMGASNKLSGELRSA